MLIIYSDHNNLGTEELGVDVDDAIPDVGRNTEEPMEGGVDESGPEPDALMDEDAPDSLMDGDDDNDFEGHDYEGIDDDLEDDLYSA